MATKGRYGRYLRLLVVMGDYVCINLAYFLICYLCNFDAGFYNGHVWGLFNIAYLPIAFVSSRIHNQRIVYANHTAKTALQSVILHAILFTALLYFFSGIADTKVEYIIGLYVLITIALPVWWMIARKLLKIYRSRGYNFRRVIIIGWGRSGKLLEKELLSDTGYGYKLMGIFDDNRELQKTHPLYRGTTADVEDFALANNIDEIYCSLPTTAEEKVLSLMHFAEHHAIHFYIVPGTTPYLHWRLHFDNIGDVPIMSIRQEPLESPINEAIKRCFDIFFSSCVILCSPVILIPVAIAIKCSSPGPIFFKQKRTGLRGKEFNCYKFRTMHVNSNSDKVQATKGDPRVSRVGEFLRKTSIDELPQFWNVLKGDMSVVGPRPHMIKHTEEYSKLIDTYMVRHLIKPGITGWAQVNGYRGETKELWQMKMRVQYDVWYIEHWDFFLDLKIIYLTVANAIRGEKNAY